MHAPLESFVMQFPVVTEANKGWQQQQAITFPCPGILSFSDGSVGFFTSKENREMRQQQCIELADKKCL